MYAVWESLNVMQNNDECIYFTEYGMRTCVIHVNTSHILRFGIKTLSGSVNFRNLDIGIFLYLPDDVIK